MRTGRAGRREDEAGLRFGRPTGRAGRGLYRAADGAENERKSAEVGAGRADSIGMRTGGWSPKISGRTDKIMLHFLNVESQITFMVGLNDHNFQDIIWMLQRNM